jgi:flagellar biosynthetic protein FliP
VTPISELPATLQGFQHNRPTAAMDVAAPQSEPGSIAGVPFSDLVSDQAEQLMTREGTDSSVKIAILLATLSLAPAIILMTTSYVRIIVVLTLLRQAFGSQQLPSTQILTALSLFVTFLVMAPTWNQIKTEAVDPYSTGEIEWEDAWQRGLVPVKHFMSRQIEIADNEDAVAMFYRYLPHQTGAKPESLQQVPVNVLLPAYLVSELKVAFLLGFQIFLPFLIVDLVVSAVTVSMGMVMLPPTMVSFPMKLILFVLVDGWNLVVSMLLQSFGSAYG